MQQNSALGRALEIVRELRRRCPWDRVQTRETLRPYLVEEVLELDHALGEGDPGPIRDEVGDLMLHLAWQLVLGEENNEFTADEIADLVVRKMQRRHPHLFDLGPKEPWETLKQRESRGPDVPAGRGLLAGLPPTLPSLQAAYRLQQKAASVGFDWPDAEGPAGKVREELAEVLEAFEGARGRGGEEHESVQADLGAERDPSDPVAAEVGDLLFAVVNLARKLRVQPTVALDAANKKFRRRFEGVEALAQARDVDLATAGLEALDRLWDEMKEGERGPKA